MLEEGSAAVGAALKIILYATEAQPALMGVRAIVAAYVRLSVSFGLRTGPKMYGSYLRKTLLKDLPGGGGGRVFSAGGINHPSGGRKKKNEWARPVPKAAEEPWDSCRPILGTSRPFSNRFGPFWGF